MGAAVFLAAVKMLKARVIFELLVYRIISPIKRFSLKSNSTNGIEEKSV